MSEGKMLKILRYILILCLLLMTSAILAQEEADTIPPIAYLLDNALHVYYPETGSNQLVSAETREPYVLFYRPIWSPDGSNLAYLTPYPEDAASSVLTVSDLQGGQTSVTVADFATPFHPIWLADGRILYATYSGERREFIAVLNAYAIAPEENADPQLLGSFEVSEGCGGGTGHPAESDYYHETSLGGYREVFALTPYGLVHDGQCIGAEVTLTNLETGESSRLAGGGLVKAVVSPDGSKVMGLKDGQLTIVNLADMTATMVASSATPDQYVWQTETSVIYSSYADNGDLLEAYDAEQIAIIEAAMGYDTEALPRRSVSIYALDLATSTDNLLYSADAFAIGRMAVRENWLIFSQVENAERWLAGMVDGTITIDNNFAVSQDTVYTQVFALNLESLEATLLLADAQQIVVAP
jgi:hypothetical protein